MQIGPAAQISRCVEEDHSAFATHTRPEDQHPVVPFAPECWIAEASDFEAGGRRCDDRLGKFFPDTQSVVLCNGKALCFAPRVDAIAKCCITSRRRWGHCCVDHRGLPAVEDRAAAEDSV